MVVVLVVGMVVVVFIGVVIIVASTVRVGGLATLGVGEWCVVLACGVVSAVRVVACCWWYRCFRRRRSVLVVKTVTEQSYCGEILDSGDAQRFCALLCSLSSARWACLAHCTRRC